MLIDNFKAAIKNLLSYTKATWNLSDYPLRYKKQTGAPGQYNIGELKPWVVQIINWWTMTGLGDTKEDAYQMLKNNFEIFRRENQLPRPGTALVFQLADNSQLDKLEDIAVDFFDKILDANYHECFISNESSLIDIGRNDKETLDKINSAYHLTLTELGDGNIARLLTLIKDKKGSR